MSSELEILILSTITISLLHTVAGPDHYLPFIALAKARRWGVGKTLFWTFVCGCGHVWSSVLLGVGGAALGWSLSKINFLEGVRGGIASWMLLAFGLVYTIWGFIRAGQNRLHKHFDNSEDGALYVFEHKHGEMVAPKERHRVTPWVMLLIFLLGPCEPMISLLYYPAAKQSLDGMFILVLTYTIFTLLTMVGMVSLGYYGFSFFKNEKLERYMHAWSGMAILVCGAGMVFMGW